MNGPRCEECGLEIRDVEDLVECNWCSRTYHKGCAVEIERCRVCGEVLVDNCKDEPPE
jgi:hypothetical protein